ncbi:hypothetical protein J2S49_001785 [Arcanobacterium wilhelmae]|uniref:Uncharacterized protein n=1 Tax=Arcanobacterium wilhelmae TaxID=1803177 RepID=A0ABT9NDD1_9ACTO|nr:hypothetical protein [Arcanobacterium wilhelmae]MDP9801709.1 hypothetical protein [Arcanobacterium wilhelmae]WFN91028.1 hypothetical protein P8A24_04025 [Arcanobacterium wilhelmae]
MLPEGTLAYVGGDRPIPPLPSGAILLPDVDALAGVIAQVSAVVADVDAPSFARIEQLASNANIATVVVGTDSPAQILQAVIEPRVACIVELFGAPALWVGPRELAPYEAAEPRSLAQALELSRHLLAHRIQETEENLLAAQIAAGAPSPFDTLVDRPTVGGNADYEELALRFADWKREWHFVTDTPIGTALRKLRGFRRKLRKWF